MSSKIMKPYDIICPAHLQSRDRIGICAPARKVGALEIQYAIKKLESWGLEVVLGKNIYSSDNQFSGTDEDRTVDLQFFLNDASIKAVVAARGGYGTMRIVDQLDFTAFNKNPKWIIGYSDLTVLHSHLNANFHTSTLHATMPINFEKDDYSTESLRRALFGEQLSYKVENNSAEKNRVGESEGMLIGGNLSLLFALQNSISDLSTDGKILFLEDLDEYLYHIDRMVLSLKRAGKISKLKGLIIGGMNDMKDNLIPFGKNAEQIIAEHTASFDFPICYGFPAGHGVKNYALLLGRNVKLTVSEYASELMFLD